MDERLLRHYEHELSFLRESGEEFARDYPKIASTLGLNPQEITDPSVNRLLEGMSFLTARVQLQMEAEFPQFTENLLELIQPQFLSPVPSMAVVQFFPDPKEGSLASGFELPADAVLRSMNDADGQNLRCEFRSTRPVTLWPIRLEFAEFLPDAGLLQGLPSKLAADAVCALRLQLGTTAGLRFSQIALDELTLFLCGNDSLPLALHEALLANALGVLARPTGSNAPWSRLIEPEHIRQPGNFPLHANAYRRSLRSDSAFAQLKKFLAFAQGQRFVTLGGLGPAVRSCPSDSLEIVVVFGRLSLPLPARINISNFALFCAPAINLFTKRADHIAFDPYHHELPVVVDKSRPLAHEVHEVLSVHGYSVGSKERQRFLPLYEPQELAGTVNEPAGFYQQHRTPSRVDSRTSVGHSGYRGSDVSISLVVPRRTQGCGELKQLAVEVLCSDRDRPLRMPIGKGNTDFVVDVSAPVLAVRCIAGPSNPVPAPPKGDSAWQAVRHLSRNYLPLASADGQVGAQALRELLSAYVATDDIVGRNLLQGIQAVRAEVVTRRLPGPGPVMFGRGLKVLVTLEDSACEGTGTLLFGAQLETFFARYAALNSFVETELHSVTRGHIKTWPARLSECITL